LSVKFAAFFIFVYFMIVVSEICNYNSVSEIYN